MNRRIGGSVGGSVLAPSERIWAWGSYNTTPATPVFYGGKNISSFTDNGTGDLTITYAVAQDATVYAMSGSAFSPTGATYGFVRLALGTALATQSVRIVTIQTAGSAAAEMDLVTFMVTGSSSASDVMGGVE